MKELAQYAAILKELLEETTQKKVSKKYARLSREHGARRERVNAKQSLPPTHELTALSKIYTNHQLIAYIINSYVLSKDIFAIEALAEGRWNFIVHCREGKEKEAIDLIDDAFLKCIPTWLPHVEDGILYLQCEGPDYLPTLLAYLAGKEIPDPQTTLDLDYKLKILRPNQESNRVICRRALSTRKNPMPAADHLANVSAILRDTKTRIYFADKFFSSITGYCSSIIEFEKYGEEKEAETTLKILQNATKIILSYCKIYERNPEEGRKIITTYYNGLIEKYPNLKENAEKYYKHIAIFGLFRLNSIATQLNELASQPPNITLKINLALIESVIRSVYNVTLQLMQNRSGLIATLESTAPDIRALIDFYDAPDKTERAKITLSTKINEKLAPTYVTLVNNFLNDITTGEFNLNEAFENILKLYLLFTEKLEAFAIVEELQDNGRSCRLFALKLLIKYYRDTKNWVLLDEKSEYYFESMRDISPDLVSNYNKVMLPFGMRTDFFLHKAENDKAFEYYQTFCEYFFYLNNPTKINPDRNLYEVANLGKRLLLAYTNSDNYFDVLLFCKDIITKIQEYSLKEEEKAYSELKLFILCYQSLWSTHSENLCEAIKNTQERSLPFVHDKLCIKPTDIADQEYFVRAFKKCGIPCALQDDGTITLKNIPTIRRQSLEKALSSTPQLKAKAEQYNANQQSAVAKKSDAGNSSYSSSSRNNFFPAVEKIGFEPKTRSKKPASLPPANPVVNKNAAVQKSPELLIINFGKHGTYKESKGVHQKIIALEGEHYKSGLFFGYLNCADADPRFLEVLQRAQIVGQKGQTGIKFFKINGKEAYKIKIVGSDIFIVGECVAEVYGHKLICFNRVQSHTQENRAQKAKDGGISSVGFAQKKG